MIAAPRPPEQKENDLRRAEKLEWQTIFWVMMSVGAMSAAMGGSQAFKTAWIEDVLSLLAPIFFLLSRHVEEKGETSVFPYGFQRAGTLAFFLSASALCAIGAFLLYEGLQSLVTLKHPTIGSKTLFGHQVWMGWIMIGVLLFSIIPPVILGRAKRKIAKRLHDEVLFVDADTNAADWQTGVASIAGIVGIACGWWWADALMASVISLSILKDGWTALKGSTIHLLDGLPRAVDSGQPDPAVQELITRLEDEYPAYRAQVRATGRYLRARLEPRDRPHLDRETAKRLMPEKSWRLIELARVMRSETDK